MKSDFKIERCWGHFFATELCVPNGEELSKDSRKLLSTILSYLATDNRKRPLQHQPTEKVNVSDGKGPIPHSSITAGERKQFITGCKT